MPDPNKNVSPFFFKKGKLRCRADALQISLEEEKTVITAFRHGTSLLKLIGSPASTGDTITIANIHLVFTIKAIQELIRPKHIPLK